MSLGLICKKIGMTNIINDDGSMTPVTVLDAANNRVVQIKSESTDGYNALQVSVGEQSIARINNCLAGHYAKAKAKAGRQLREFRVSADDLSGIELGQVIGTDVFAEGQSVDVQGVTKGKGFAGVVKRHNFRMQDATHGNSLSHRAPGSIGQCQEPGRVFKGKKMAGQMGNVTRTVQNLQVYKIDGEKNLIMVKGGVPGANNGYVVIKASVKHAQDNKGGAK